MENRNIEFVFLDLDDTVLDFAWAEKQALTAVMETYGIPTTEQNYEMYHRINLKYWHFLEDGKTTLEELKVQRFRELLAKLCMDGDASAMADLYLEKLGQGHHFLPGALETLEELREKGYRLFLVTNGNPAVQYSRLDSAGIRQYFERIFISLEIGHSKPSLEFFDHCFSQIPGFVKSKAMIVGDSLSSDIRGGLNAGISTCWVNPHHQITPLDIVPEYQIETLPQLVAILDTLRLL